MQTTALPALTAYTARDGKPLFYRRYDAAADIILIMLHGITEDSKYLHPLAQFIAGRGLATVYMPDLRGYGTYPDRRGDIDYVGQFDDDLEDLIRVIRSDHPQSRIVMGGHSAGGGTAIRTVAAACAGLIDGYLLLAPAVSPNAPINRKQTGPSPMQFRMGRIVLLTIAQLLGIRRWHGATVLVKYKPEHLRHGTETLRLSFRLLMSRVAHPRYERFLAKLTRPTLVLVGSEDEEFVAEAYAPLFAKYGQAEVKVLPGLDHDGIVASERTYREVEQWLNRLQTGKSAVQ